MIEDQDYFKQQLYEHFKKTGILDNLKASLRQQLADQLQSKDASTVNLKNKQDQQKEFDSYVFDKVILSNVVCDYLRTHDTNYTYSVFLPEVRMTSEEVLATSDLLEFLRIGPKDYADLTKKFKDRKISVLEILMYMIKTQKLKPTMERFVQTDNETQKNLKSKLDMLDDEFSNQMNYHTLRQSKSMEEQMLEYRKECDKRYQSCLEHELQRIRDVEITQMRFQEQQSLETKLYHYRRELEKMYQDKLQNLKDRERTSLDLCKRKIEDFEKQAYELRQTHIKELDTVYKKEVEFRQHSCAESEVIKEEREKIKTLEHELKVKIRDYDAARQNIQTRIENEIKTRKQMLNKEEVEREARQKDLERRLEQESEFFKQQRQNVTFLEQQRQYLSKDCDSLRRDVQELEYIREEQSKEITTLRDMVRNLKEYKENNDDRLQSQEKRVEALKDDVARVNQQLLTAHEEIEAKRDELVQLHQSYSRDMEKSHQQLIENERLFFIRIEEIQERHKYDLSVWKEQKNRFEDIVNRLEDENFTLRKEVRVLRRHAESVGIEGIAVQGANINNNNNSLYGSGGRGRGQAAAEAAGEQGQGQNDDYGF